mmetsp:Transcript_32102/g.95883  ORF Transcript_32102/g.95883 Transcript_32102/m.95883 type:complete len:363 (+) Transcript_32102:1193-2281(+)
MKTVLNVVFQFLHVPWPARISASLGLSRSPEPPSSMQSGRWPLGLIRPRYSCRWSRPLNMPLLLKISIVCGRCVAASRPRARRTSRNSSALGRPAASLPLPLTSPLSVAPSPPLARRSNPGSTRLPGLSSAGAPPPPSSPPLQRAAFVLVSGCCSGGVAAFGRPLLLAFGASPLLPPPPLPPPPPVLGASTSTAGPSTRSSTFSRWLSEMTFPLCSVLSEKRQSRTLAHPPRASAWLGVMRSPSTSTHAGAYRPPRCSSSCRYSVPDSWLFAVKISIVGGTLSRSSPGAPSSRWRRGTRASSSPPPPPPLLGAPPSANELPPANEPWLRGVSPPPRLPTKEPMPPPPPPAKLPLRPTESVRV